MRNTMYNIVYLNHINNKNNSHAKICANFYKHGCKKIATLCDDCICSHWVMWCMGTGLFFKFYCNKNI